MKRQVLTILSAAVLSSGAVAQEVMRDTTIQAVRIGYLDVSRSALAGAVDQVTAERMNKGLITSSLDALNGQAAGVQITGNQEAMVSAVRVRGAPLVYVPEAVEMELTLSPYVETAGARMKKYAVDKNAMKDGKLMDNDIVLFRYADVLLMRAEALLRMGEVGMGQGNYDQVRRRAKVPLRSLTLDNILDERLLELCWEGWRRQDLIRFGQYESLFEGDEYDTKVDESDGHTTVYPIPADVMALNHNLTQNPGY